MAEKLKRLLSGHAHNCACEDCAHEHEHEHDDFHGFDRFLVIRLVTAAVLFGAGIFFEDRDGLISLLFFAASALCAGYDVLVGAVLKLFSRQVFDENLLMTVAAVAAFLIGEGEEGAAVMLLYQIGDLFQDYAVGKTRHSVTELMGARPEFATVFRDGAQLVVSAGEVVAGDTVLVRPGELFAVDCVVLDGSSTLDCSALTGESSPRPVGRGDAVMSGSLNTASPLRCQASASAAESTSARILSQVQAQQTRKGRTEKFITKFARIYTPAVLGLAVVLVAGLCLFSDTTFSDAIGRALVFLVIACPCALVISVPLAYFAGIGGASRLGILFKSSGALDAVAKTKAVVFDKAGTLTTGNLRVSEVKSERMEADMMLRTAAHAELYSAHPIGKAIVSAYGGSIFSELIKGFKEEPGRGVSVGIGDVSVCLGNADFVREHGAEVLAQNSADIAVYMSVDGVYAGRFLLCETVREDSAEAIQDLEAAGGERIVMLTGDNAETSDKLARALGISEYYAECLPEDKVAHVSAMKNRLGARGTLILVGDGVSAAPVLSAADVGIAMGGLGSDAAVEAADVVIMDDRPTKVATAILAARSTRSIVWQNIIFAIAAKVAVLVLGALGISTIWFAVFADVGVALLAVLNSMRAFYIKTPKY